MRTILSAGVLVLPLLACDGAVAGATWVVDDDACVGAGYTMLAGGGRC